MLLPSPQHSKLVFFPLACEQVIRMARILQLDRGHILLVRGKTIYNSSIIKSLHKIISVTKVSFWFCRVSEKQSNPFHPSLIDFSTNHEVLESVKFIL